MSVGDLCYICNDEAVARCESCGGAVCGEHYDAATGFCVRCEGGRRFE
jgi:hypothetical protein